MGLFLVKNSEATNVHKTKQLIVAAEAAADAKVVAASHFSGDASWASATTTAIAEETLDAASSMVGYVFTLTIFDGGAQTPADDPLTVTYTGLGTDDLDDVAAALVILLNATTDIANAAYSAPDLTLASIADGIGDATVHFVVTPPSGDTSYDISSLLYATITHEGIAAAVLEIALVADTEAHPEVITEA